jgi:ribose-phosphate pyrophosphokinase
MKLFALKSSLDFGQLVAGCLGITLGALEEREFEDGEHKCRPLENVRSQEVFVIQSLYSDHDSSVNDKLCRLLFLIAALKDASARKVTAVVPYLCYARKDRKTKPRDPVTTRYIACLFEAAGVDGVLTIDVHNIQAFQNSFRCNAENLEAKNLFTGFLLTTLANEKDVVVMSPDIGGIKRAEQFSESLGKKLNSSLPVVFMEKYRSSGEVWGEKVAGDVTGKTVIIVDDLISTGGTLARAAAACKRAGAKKALAIATHGIFTGTPDKTLQEQSLERIAVTNTIPPFRLNNTQVKEKVTVINAAPLFAEAIKRISEGGSIVELLQD